MEGTFIATGTTIKGKVTTTEDIRVDGKIIGDVNAQGKLIVGAHGVVEGVLRSQHTEISGHLKLDKINAQTLILTSSANLQGDIEVETLQVDSGAIIEGNIKMTQSNAFNNQKDAFKD